MQAMSAIALPNGNIGHFRRRPEKFQRILTYMEKVLFAAAFFVAYTIQAVTGFAGNIFAMPVGTHVMGLSSSVAVLNAMGFFACGMLAVLNFKYINWRELAKMTCGMLPFLALGIWLDTVLPLPVLLRIYGAIIVFIGIRNLLSKEQRFLPKWLLAIIVAAAGLIQGMFVSGGAFLVIYAVQKMKDKQQFRATLSALWAILNFLYALLAFTQGHFTAMSCSPWASASPSPLWRTSSARSSRSASAKRSFSNSPTSCCCWSASCCSSRPNGENLGCNRELCSNKRESRLQ